MKRSFATWFALLLMLVAAIPAAGAQKGAVLRGGVSKFTPLSTSISVVPLAVDGKYLPSIFSPKFKEGVPPGTHRVLLSLHFTVGFLEESYEAQVYVTAKLASGRNYKTVGRIEKRKVSAWIVDAQTLERVSDVYSFTMEDCAVRVGICIF